MAGAIILTLELLLLVGMCVVHAPTWVILAMLVLIAIDVAFNVDTGRLK